MTIQAIKRKKGTMYRYRFTLKGITVSSEMYYDKALCQRDEAKARAEILQGVYVAPERHTVEECWALYNEMNPVAFGGMKNRNNILNKLRSKGLADKPISKITTLQLEKFASEMRQSGLADSTYRNYLGILFGFFNWLHKKDIIPKNPAKPIDLPRQGAAKVIVFDRESLLFRLEQIKQIDFTLYGPAILAAFFGLRIGEACAINLDGDFDFEHKVLRVTKQYGTTKSTSCDFDTPKSAAGIREVPILDFVEPIIKEHINTVRKLYFNGRIKTPPGEPIPFCITFLGYRMAPNYADKKWKQMNKANGWDHLTLHKLRHTYATLCRDAEIVMDTIADLLGHADTKTTKKIYAHKTTVQIQNASDKLNNYFDKKEKSS